MRLNPYLTGLLAASLMFAWNNMAQAQSYQTIGPQVWASDVNDSGVVAAFNSGGSYFTWTQAQGLINIGGLADAGQPAISADGNWVGGNAANPNNSNRVEAARYDRSTQQWSFLGRLAGSSGTSASSHWGMNPSGTISVGLGWINAGTAHAVRFDNTAGTATSLGSTVAGSSSRANAVNGDGLVIGGWQDGNNGRQGAVWRWNGTQYDQSLLELAGAPLGEVQAITPDGNYAIGGGEFGWRMNLNSGVVDSFGQLGVHTFNPSYGATAISADGRKVIGYERGFPPNPVFGTEPYIWIEGQGTLNLNTWVTDVLGLNLQGARLATVLGISDNGRYIVGINDAFQGFVIDTIPEASSLLVFMAGVPLLVLRRNRSKVF